MQYVMAFTSSLIFWAFITIKFVGTSFVAWSWWWALLPIVPLLSLVVQRMGL